MIKTFMGSWRETEGSRDLDGISAHGNDILRALVQSNLSDDDQASLLLTCIWGISTNVGKMLYWLFAHLLCDKTAYMKLQTEVNNAVENKSGGKLRSLFTAHPRIVTLFQIDEYMY